MEQIHHVQILYREEKTETGNTTVDGITITDDDKYYSWKIIRINNI